MSRKSLGEVCVVLLTICLCSCGYKVPSNYTAKQSVIDDLAFAEIVDAQNDGFAYAYAPSIILDNGTYHVFFCSKGWLKYPSWDAIRYTTSSDGQNWSRPEVVLQATAKNGMDMAACDPSVVFYQGFYYLYYSSAITTAPHVYQTVIQVARASKIQGPYRTYTRRGTWENTPEDPKVIIYPLQNHGSQPSGYGAGQQSVVVKNGRLLMWYTDDSLFVNGQPEVRTYMLESGDPTKWTADIQRSTNLVGQASIDVKFDGERSQFTMVRIENEFSTTSYLGRAYSSDGVTWTLPENMYPTSQFPMYSHDAGIEGDKAGNLAGSGALIGFGAPYGLAHVNDWAKWNLYTVRVTKASDPGFGAGNP